MAKTNDAKWFLDSTTVRAALIAIVPSIKILLEAMGIKVHDDIVNALVDVAAFVIGIGASSYLIWKRHKQAPLKLSK